jgi:hypothetical protein
MFLPYQFSYAFGAIGIWHRRSPLPCFLGKEKPLETFPCPQEIQFPSLPHATGMHHEDRTISAGIAQD